MEWDMAQHRPVKRESFVQSVAGLKKEIARAITNKSDPVNMSVPRHSVITLALHHFAYDLAHRGFGIPVVFKDGSQPPLFPVGVLEPLECKLPADDSDAVRVGLMSMRHPELDYLVDLYATRNKELADEATMADEEGAAFRGAVALLEDSTLRAGGEVWVYHTGLEPMVVGFYRGVLSFLAARVAKGLPRNLVLRTRFYAPHERDDSPEETSETRFSCDSPGAQDANYRFGPSWA